MTPVPLWLNVLLVIGLALGGALDGGRIVRRHPGLTLDQVLGKARYLYAVVAALIPMIGAHLWLDSRPQLGWHLPDWLAFYYTAIVWGVIIALFVFLFGLALSVAYRTAHRERHKLAAAGVMLVGAVQLAQWSFTRPIAAELGVRLSHDGIILQSTPVSCAAASGANIAHALGLPRSERDMARAFGTTTMGTSAPQVVLGFRGLGVRCKKREIPDRDPAKLALPAMLFVDDAAVGVEGHAIFAWLRNGKREIRDPLDGSVHSAKSLHKIWRGRALECGLR